MAKKHNVSFIDQVNIVTVDRLLWYQRNKILWDVQLQDNNQL